MKVFSKILFILGPILFILYIISMVIIPFNEGGWVYTLKTWQDWQSFNTGVIAIFAAIIATVTAINIDENVKEREESRRSYEQQQIIDQRRREFIAARAFLPNALSNITHYAQNCTVNIRSVYIKGRLNTFLTLEQKQELTDKFRKAEPYELEKVFQECIKLGDEEESNQISKLLIELQVFISRMKIFEKDSDIPISYMREMLIYSVYFQFKIDGFYDFARKGQPIRSPSSNAESYYSRLSTLGDDDEVISNKTDKLLETYINRYVKMQTGGRLL